VARLARLEHERAGVEAERRAMLSSLSHDLRTPLAAMRAAVEALADGVAPDPDRYLAAIQRDLSLLDGLIDDLFLLARIEAGPRPAAEVTFDLAEVADESIEALAPIAHERGVHLAAAIEGPARVRGSAAELGRVVRNLLDNAIRHAPADSTVTVEVGHGPGVTVRVRDEGDGFPRDFAGRAFEPFSRADDARTRTTGGAGLGLAIARGLVEAHGGRISIEPGTGGSVVFTLPAPPATVAG
jgi:signal transduction histidine kinase